MPRPFCALLALCLLGSLAQAIPANAQQATFASMGGFHRGLQHSGPYDVREDGRLVVGFEFHQGPVSWTRAGGFEALGPRGIDTYGRAYGVSADGRTIVGEWHRKPFRWTRQTGLVDFGDMDGRAFDVSADGSVVVGSGGDGPDHAFRWTAGDGFQDLGTFGGVDGLSNAYAISDDGRCIIGRSMTPGGKYRAFRWTEREGLRSLGSLGERGSVANGVSKDGRVIVGALLGAPQRPFMWTSKGGMQILPSIQSGRGAAMDVSDDGTVIVGESRTSIGDAACIWTDGEPRYLGDLLQNHYGIDLSGWYTLSEITACSGDGTKLVGSGNYDRARYGFVATIPPPPTMTTHVPPVAIHRAVVGETFRYPFVARDSGGEPLTFDAAGLPPTATLTPTIGPAGASFKGLLRWTPTEADLGRTHEVHLFVRDAEQRRASLRFRIRAVAADAADIGSSITTDAGPRAPRADRSLEGAFAAPLRVATVTAQEMASDLFATCQLPLAEEACRAAVAAQAIGEVADAIDARERADSSPANDPADYRSLRAKQADAARLAADRLYRLYKVEDDEEALFASAYAYRACLYAAMDAVEREMD
ncbi:MAG TPA: hypothetical protein VGN57_17495 [Pirellulaceae bacterium]|jgi:probable HAF family extracellular repeat protein|nr:hypothetical protein [Pirellulaceae bacterium]